MDAAIGGVGWLVVSGVRNEWDELTTSAADGLAELQGFVEDGPIPVDEQQLSQARDAVVDLLTGEQVRTGAVSGAAAAAEVVAGIFLAVILLFFLLKDGPEIWRFLISPVSPVRRQRLEIVGAIGCVDYAVAEVEDDKLDTWQSLHFDVFFKGDDWRGTRKGRDLERRFAEVGVEVVYFPYTVDTSSTALRRALAVLNQSALVDDARVGA